MDMFLNLLQLGFHGFAFALFYLSFKRFGDISKRTLPPNASSDAMNSHNDRTRMLLRELRWFMAVSLVFFVFGSATQIYSGSVPHDITVTVRPDSIPEGLDRPQIFKSDELQSEGDDFVCEVMVARKDRLTVYIGGILKYIDRLEARNDMKTAGLELGALGE